MGTFEIETVITSDLNPNGAQGSIPKGFSQQLKSRIFQLGGSRTWFHRLTFRPHLRGQKALEAHVHQLNGTPMPHGLGLSSRIAFTLREADSFVFDIFSVQLQVNCNVKKKSRAFPLVFQGFVWLFATINGGRV